MSLNGSMIAKDASGRLMVGVLDVDVPAGFNGGTPMTAAGALAITSASGAAMPRVAGLLYDDAGRLSISGTGPAVVWVAGLPVDSLGRLFASTANPAYWAPNGIPITAGGAVSMTGTGGAADFEAPTNPTGLLATVDSYSQITLNWNPSTDNVGVAGYSIERCAGLDCVNFGQIGTSVTPSFVDSGLSNSTVYRYRVLAYDAATNMSGYSNVAEGVTQSIPGIVIGDTVAATEALETLVGKVVADIAAASESTVFASVKALADSLVASESFAWLASLLLQEQLTAVDAAALMVGKQISEAALTADTSLTNAIGMALSDDSVMTDSPSFSGSGGLTPSDNSTGIDALSWLMSTFKSDDGIATDIAALMASKDFLDSVNMTDALTELLTKVLTDAVTSTDVMNQLMDRISGDTAAAADTLSRMIDRGPFTDDVGISENIQIGLLFASSLSDSGIATDAFTPTLVPGPAFQTITYVGGQVSGRAGTTSSLVVNFALTGGSDAVPKADDLVIITCVVGSAARNAAQAVAGYTALGQLNQSAQTNDTSMNVSYKFMGSTPDTSVTIPATGNNADGQAYTIQVFRGVDSSSFLDVAAVAAGGTGTGRPNPGALTPTTAGAWIVICGGGAAGTAAAYVAPANFTTNFLTTALGVDTTDAMVGSGYWSGWTSGAVDPAVYTGGTTNTTDSWASYTLALRPAPVLSAITSPAALFAAGELGLWFDPSDFSTMWQDTAGTVPVTAVGQSVARIDDKSGRGNHLIQATAGLRPVLQQDGKGKYYLQFDGVDDIMQSIATVDLSTVNKMTFWAGLHKPNDLLLSAVIGLTGDPYNTVAGFQITAPDWENTPTYGFSSRGTVQSPACIATGFPAPNTAVVSGYADIAGDFEVIRVNGVQAATVNSDQGTGNYANATVYMGRQGGGLQFAFPGRLYGMIWRAAATHLSHVRDIEQWMQDKTIGPVTTPADLFAAGEQGIWLDPSDLSTMFQDIAGTQPVTAPGQFVGKMLDKSGRGNHFTSPSDSNRPTYQVDGNGKPHLVMAGPNAGIGSGFDGAGATTYGASPHIFCCIGAYKSQDTFMQYIIEHSTTSQSSAGTFTMRFPATATPNGDSGWRTRGSGGQHELLTPAGVVPSPALAVLTGRSNLAAPSSLHRVNGIQQAAATTALGGNTASFVTYIGRRGTGDGYFNGRLYGLVTRFTAATSDAEMVTIEQWMAQKIGQPIAAVVQGANDNFGATRTASVTLSGVKPGNSIIVCTAGYTGSDAAGSPNVTVSDGVAYTRAALGQNGSGASAGKNDASIHYRHNHPGGTVTVTVDNNPAASASNSYGWIRVMEVSGLVNATPNQTASNSGQSATPTSGTTAATTAANCWVLAVLSCDDAPTDAGIDVPATTGYTNLMVQQNSSAELAAAFDAKLVTSTGTQSAAWGTMAASYRWAACIAAFAIS